MNYRNIFNSIFRPAAVMALAFAAVSCDEEIEIGRPDEGNYQVSDGSTKEVIYVADKDGKREFSTVEFRNSGSTSLRLYTPGNVKSDCDVTFTYDPTVLSDYNTANGSNYPLYPENLVTLGEADGVVTIPAGSSRSSELVVTINSDGQTDPEKTYVIPFRMSVSGNNGYTLGDIDQTRLIFVKDFTKAPDCTKLGTDGQPGMRIVSIIESNDTNPLNHLSFTLGDTGVPMFDVVVLFSANIRFNRETEKIYLSLNENLTAQLGNLDKYIKPLQRKGMKVLISILGDHDGSGQANLTETGAKQFAQELRNVCDRFGLDGVMFDDEYSEYYNYNLHKTYPELFCSPSSTAGARLVYETKRAMPDRLVTVYRLGNLSRFPAITVDGNSINAGDYVDMVFEDYGRSHTPSNFPGVTNENWAIYSQEFAQGRYATVSRLNTMLQNGHRIHMVFAMDPNRDTFQGQLNALNNCASVFYGGECKFDGVIYPKDWI